jgi:hypothetical protein
MSEVQFLEHMLANARKGLPVGYGILDRYGNPIRDVGLAVIDLRGWRELSIKSQGLINEER